MDNAAARRTLETEIARLARLRIDAAMAGDRLTVGALAARMAAQRRSGACSTS